MSALPAAEVSEEQLTEGRQAQRSEGKLVLGAGGGLQGKLTNSLVRSSHPALLLPCGTARRCPHPPQKPHGGSGQDSTAQVSRGASKCHPDSLGLHSGASSPGVPAGPRTLDARPRWRSPAPQITSLGSPPPTQPLHPRRHWVSFSGCQQSA